jgi:hypothetical protein
MPDDPRDLAARLADALAAVDAEGRAGGLPWTQPGLPPLYGYAISQLRAAGRFSRRDAADSLRVAEHRLTLPGAPTGGEPRDADDVDAFLDYLQREEMAHGGGDGWFVLNAQVLPF